MSNLTGASSRDVNVRFLAELADTLPLADPAVLRLTTGDHTLKVGAGAVVHVVAVSLAASQSQNFIK